MRKKALITGITGQDGAYLAALLLEKGYHILGLARNNSPTTLWRLEWLGIKDKIEWLRADLGDLAALTEVMQRYQPHEVYNLAAQSFVQDSLKQPILTAEVSAIGALNILEAVRIASPSTRIFQASTSELFDKTHDAAKSETTPFYPRSPYASAKLYAHWMMINYRENYNLFSCSGILFNHESPLRGIEFVTRKVTNGVARIKLGLQNTLALGNIDSKRDWGHARDYVKAMWLMLQQDNPDDFVIATGRTTSVREMCKVAFETVGLDYQQYVTQNPALLRPTEAPVVLGNPQKAKEKLSWQAQVSWEDMIHEMVNTDLARLKNIP